jgi:CHAT domain-containing protein/tetratricopeptide (TPR) repeat protein
MDEQRLNAPTQSESQQEVTQADINFFIEILQAVASSNGNPQVVYPLLEQNLARLDDRLARVLQVWTALTLPKVELEQRQALTWTIGNLSNLIGKFPLGNRATNMEISIIGYEITLTVFTRECFPVDWANTQYNLGVAYAERILGERAENLEQVIACYHQALEERTRERFPIDWASTQYNLGNAYLHRIRGERAENLEQAIACYHQALEERTRERFPIDWARTQHNLGAAYLHRIRGEQGDNIEQAIACFHQALEVYTRERFPVEWAGSQLALGGAYFKRIWGGQAENIEQAIACFHQALEVYTRERFPVEWAMTQNNLGLAYRNRIRGEQADNLEQALACFHQALEEYTHERFPSEWAGIQWTLGFAYQDQIRGERSDNLEQALACFHQALKEYTRERFPGQWAGIQCALGNVYTDRIRGERAENLEQAIACYLQALEEHTRSRFPSAWASIQNDLGLAYWQRIRGERADNLEQAIAHCHLALEEYTRSRFPFECAITQLNLGIAYRDRIRGERAENIEQAIACYHQALEEHTRDRFPFEWARIQYNLGIAYRQRIRGERAENIEQAIACYQRTLEEYTRERDPFEWARIQHNLGNAYCDRIRGNRAENIEQAIACFHQALEEYTRERFPVDWARTQESLGAAYWHRIRGNGADNWIQAFKCFQQALLIYTPTTFPLECLRSGSSLGNTAFMARQWSIAINGYAVAIEALETSRSWATNEDRRQEILAESIDIYEKIVQACINNGQLDRAVEYVERSRSKRLVDLMASNDLYWDGNIPPQVQDYLQQYEQLQQQIDKERNRPDTDTNRELVGAGNPVERRAAFAAKTETIQALEAQKQELWLKLRQLDPVLAGEIQVTAPDMIAMQQLIADQPPTAIVSFYTTDNDTHIFVLCHNHITCHTCAGQGFKALQNWIYNNWLLPYVEDRSTWKQQLPTFLTELAERLQLRDLVANHLTGLTELILVPHLYLHQIPFAALPLSDGQLLGDSFLLTTIPSCQILEFCKNRPHINVETCHGTSLQYGIVEDATEDLPCTSYECEQIAQLYHIPDAQRLKGRRQATVKNYQLLARFVQSIHSSHHASSRLDNPLESALQLGDGVITLGQLLSPGWRLPNLGEVFLSCCETNLGLTPITDDLLTLATGFLCAGARSVISTLWAVDDLATALFSICYYQQRRQGDNRAVALQQAQKTLRQLTGKTFKSVYRPQLEQALNQRLQSVSQLAKSAQHKRDQYPQDSPEYQSSEQEREQYKKLAQLIYNAKTRLKQLSQATYPFADPFYWAAFTCQGLP